MSRIALLDIEGTIGSISFVHDVLFPYASARLDAFARSGHPEVPALLADTRALAGSPDADLDATIAILRGWIAEDRKATPLKALQGLIWEEGFTAGALRAHLYPDAAAAIRRWEGRAAIYSSGSIHAQRLYVRHSDAGDLSAAVIAHFDTTTGPKREAASYTAIARALGVAPAQITFFSDVVAELDAAAAAGCATVVVDRDRPATVGPHRAIASFDGVEP